KTKSSCFRKTNKSLSVRAGSKAGGLTNSPVSSKIKMLSGWQQRVPPTEKLGDFCLKGRFSEAKRRTE
ncbi:MAG: hypothetical protein Q4F41_20525, partial [Eubacteriales bacterium]|nr:hypothetical protein [Eubacteriales bacterium]